MADTTQYTETDWEDWDGIDPTSGTPLDADHFNHMENGIHEANSHVFIDDEGYLCVHIPQAVPYTEGNKYSVPPIIEDDTEG